MEKLTGCFLLAVLSSVLAKDELLYFREGGTLVLKPRFSKEITSIMWKHNYKPMAEWVKEKLPLQYDDMFEGRTTLNITTGSLEIINVSRAESGEYSVMINDNQADHYNATLIKDVPKPTVEVKPLACTPASEKCSLTCNGNTEEAEPVTYSWKMGDGEWMDGKKDRSIINDETIQSVKTFTCRMKNPISEQESDPNPNSFFKEKVSASSGVGFSVDLFLLVVGILAAVVGEGF